MIRPLLAAAALLALASAGHAQQQGYVSCSGVLTKDSDDPIYRLKASASSYVWPASHAWCDADLVEQYAGADAINRLLSVCKIDGRCHIKGILSGGRRIRWTTILEVTRP